MANADSATAAANATMAWARPAETDSDSEALAMTEKGVRLTWRVEFIALPRNPQRLGTLKVPWNETHVDTWSERGEADMVGTRVRRHERRLRW